MDKDQKEKELKERRKKGPAFYAKWNELTILWSFILPVYIILIITGVITWRFALAGFLLQMATMAYACWAIRPYMENYKEKP